MVQECSSWFFDRTCYYCARGKRFDNRHYIWLVRKPTIRLWQYTKTVHQKAQGYPLQASYSVHDAEWAEYTATHTLNYKG